MQVSDVACGGNGQIWMTDTNRNLYTKTGTEDAANPQGDLEPMSVDTGEWRSISVGENGQFFGMKKSGEIWEACARTGYSKQEPSGNAFSCFDTSGSVKNFNAGHNEIWMVNVHNEVYKRIGVDHAQTPYGVGHEWMQIAGEMTYVATAEEGIVWGIDVDGEVWRYDGGEISI
jgi:hypothetical protein